MTTPDTSSSNEPEESPKYRVSFERLAELNRSAAALVASRQAASSPPRSWADLESTDPQQLVDEIAKNYSDEQGFIRSEMPIQEIIFRILLTHRNEPTTLQDLHYELTETWSTPVRPITITEGGLRRILDADTHYGFEIVNP